MRIAIVGSHYSGKTTLAEALAEKLTDFTLIEEPYHQMTAEGYEFPDMPTVEDFYEQLSYSVKSIEKSDDKTIFDRSPLDFLAYALSSEDRDEVDLQEWLEKCQDALEYLDAIIFCPIDDPDRISVPTSENKKLRRRVDERLREYILDDSLGVFADLKVIEVSGPSEKRLLQVLNQLKNI